jgi:hypothetical protein
MNAQHTNESARITWKDALIILFLVFYAWFSYDTEDGSHQAKRPSPQSSMTLPLLLA